MWRYLGIVLMALVIEGCQTPPLWTSSELNTFQVVSYGYDVRHYRAYFTRADLSLLPNKKRTMFFEHTKHHTLAVLLRRRNRYELYDMSDPSHPKIRFETPKPLSLSALYRRLRRYGYRPANLQKLGIQVAIAPRRYRGVKTWMIEIEDFSRLKKRYLKAIKLGQSALVRRLKPIPAVLIAPELRAAFIAARTPKKRKALIRIARRLRINLPETSHPAQTSQSSSPHRFEYYLKRASESELRKILNTSTEKTKINSVQRRALRQRLHQLERDRLLKKGSLDELIDAYRREKDPLLKRRIMELLEKRALPTLEENH